MSLQNVIQFLLKHHLGISMSLIRLIFLLLLTTKILKLNQNAFKANFNLCIKEQMMNTFEFFLFDRTFTLK